MLSGGEVADRDGAFTAAPRLAAPGRSVIVTLGGAASSFTPTGKPAFWIAPKPVKVVSTHGAGDCFVGALAAQLAHGDDLRARRNRQRGRGPHVSRIDITYRIRWYS